MNWKLTWSIRAVMALMVLGTVGCGGFRGSVPISPMMFAASNTESLAKQAPVPADTAPSLAPTQATERVQ